MERNSQSLKIVTVGLLIALAVVLNRIVPATPTYHITLDFLPIFMVAVLYGPIWSLVAYTLTDVIGSFVFPFGAFNPGITVTLAAIGLLFGLIFYKQNLQGKNLIIRTVMAALGTFLIKFFGTSYFLWLYFFASEKSYWLYLVTRIPNCVAIFVFIMLTIPLMYKYVLCKIPVFGLQKKGS